MVDIILNERLWVEDVLSSLYHGKKPGEAIGRIAKYYRQSGFKRTDVHRKIEEFLLRCNPTVNLFAWQDTIEAAINMSEKYKLIEIQHIQVTQKELDVIQTADGVRMRRLLFTLVCCAKYLNAVNPKNNNWVYFDHKDIFRMANVSATIKERASMLHTLYQNGYISLSRIVDNTNIRVEFVGDDGDPAVKVEDFRNLGNQYSAYIDGGYMQCQCCGVFVRKRTNNQRYCRKCAIGVDNESISPPDIAA